jgi:energy-converting hydrogenase Eha subunit B
MATGIVSIGARVPGVPGVDAVLFALNIAVLVALLSVHSSGSRSPPGS